LAFASGVLEALPLVANNGVMDDLPVNETVDIDAALFQQLEKRLGAVHARQRLGIESESGHRVFGKGLNFFHPENWYSTHSLIKNIIRLSGMYRRGQRNACNIQLKHNVITLANLPRVFDGFTILHLSDLHVDMYPKAIDALIEVIKTLNYDACVITGDYRARTYGDIKGTLRGMKVIAECLKSPVYGVLGNHDSIRMVPELEAFGIRMLLNESITLSRDDARLHIAGIDDAHYFRVDNIEKAAQVTPINEPSIMLSHTPEVYRQVAHAKYDVMFCGHTHGGQICLPGGTPVILDANCPRYMGAGAWDYQGMRGYTSVGSGTSIVNVRFNCLPEVTLHQLQCD